MNNNSMLIETIKEYISDECSTYAVLITGPWGVGKTYFVKNHLCETLRNANTGKSIHYLSLNGITEVNEISKELFYNLEILKSSINTTINLMQTVATHFLPFTPKIDTSKISEIIDNYSIELKNCILIMDDYERCGCDHNELMGYINQLVEHNGSKVIIIANEQKIDGESYKKLKEKVIGYTLQYEADYMEVIDSLNQKYIDGNIYNELLTALKDNKNQIINIARNYQHYNLRTYIFFLSVLKRIYNIYPDKLVINELIGFIFETSIRFKTEQEPEDDLNYNANFRGFSTMCG